MARPEPLVSPTLTATSFDIISSASSVSSYLNDDSDSDDQIIWSVSDDSDDEENYLQGSRTPGSDDFILLSHSPGHSTPQQSLTHAIESLSLSPSVSEKPRDKTLVDLGSAYPSPQASPQTKKKYSLKAKPQSTGLGSRSVVDDLSDRAETPSDNGEQLLENASQYITSFLSNPPTTDSHSRLTLYQCLIIELGLGMSSSSLPQSLKAAKAFLKSHVFVNVRDYLDVRSQGPEAVQSVLHPSKSALIRDLRKTKKNQVSREKIKRNGLSVLLVTVFH